MPSAMGVVGWEGLSEDVCVWFVLTVGWGWVYFQFKKKKFYRSSSTLHRRSSTEILPDYWGTFCAGSAQGPFFRFWYQQDSNPCSCPYEANALTATLS